MISDELVLPHDGAVTTAIPSPGAGAAFHHTVPHADMDDGDTVATASSTRPGSTATPVPGLPIMGMTGLGGGESERS